MIKVIVCFHGLREVLGIEFQSVRKRCVVEAADPAGSSIWVHRTADIPKDLTSRISGSGGKIDACPNSLKLVRGGYRFSAQLDPYMRDTVI